MFWNITQIYSTDKKFAQHGGYDKTTQTKASIVAAFIEMLSASFKFIVQ